MIYTDLTKKALQIAFTVHQGQVDKAGLPYIFHPFHVAEQMDDEKSVCVALLHDVLEDGGTAAQLLVAEGGFPSDIREALNLLTHQQGTTYLDYIRAIKGNELATKVKLADLKHNMDLTRLNKAISEKDLARNARYQKALNILTQP